MYSTAFIALATAETDEVTAQRERAKGAAAAQTGASRDACPWTGGRCQQWWLAGYDQHAGLFVKSD